MKQKVNDLIYLQIILKWLKDEGEHAYGYSVHYTYDGYGSYECKINYDSLKPIKEASWKEVFEKHFKNGIIAYLKLPNNAKSIIDFNNDELKIILNSIKK